MPNIINTLFKVSILITLLLSFYIFMNTLLAKSNEHKTIFTTWQFPMLLALFLDVWIY